MGERPRAVRMVLHDGADASSKETRLGGVEKVYERGMKWGLKVV